MDARRFDAIARTLVSGGISRRFALLSGCMGLGAAMLGSRPARAQEATPAPVSADSYQPLAGNHEELLFVQTFGQGALTPKEGAAGEYVLTLSDGSGMTLYMSDRPNRAVGSVTNAQFIDMLGYTPNDPPNAAFVTQGEGGDQVLVVELLNAAADEATGGMTYDVSILGEADVDMEFRGVYRSDPGGPERYGQNSLFIDDFVCGDHQTDCYTNANDTDVGTLGKFGFHWCLGGGSGNPMSCCPSEGCPTVNSKCNDTFPDACQAGGGCYAAAPYFVRHDGLRNESFSCYSIIG